VDASNPNSARATLHELPTLPRFLKWDPHRLPKPSMLTNVYNVLRYVSSTGQLASDSASPRAMAGTFHTATADATNVSIAGGSPVGPQQEIGS